MFRILDYVEQIVFPNLGIILVNHSSYWKVVNINDKKQSFTWAVYDKLSWLEKLKEMDKIYLWDYHEFLVQIKTTSF